MGERIADILRVNLMALRTEGIGPKVNGETAGDVVTHIADRPVQWHHTRGVHRLGLDPSRWPEAHICWSSVRCRKSV